MNSEFSIDKEIELCHSRTRISFWNSFSNLFELTTLANNTHDWYSMDSEELFKQNAKRLKSVNTYSETDIKYTFNEFGFRSVPFTDESHKDFNILFGGCSITAGVGLPEEHIWTSQISEMIQNDLEPAAKIQNFNISLGGRSIDSVARHLYQVITKNLVRPDLVLLNLPPIWRKELAIYENGYADIIHYIPSVEYKNSVHKRYSSFVSDLQSFHEAIRNLAFISMTLEKENIPWMFSFWDDHEVSYDNSADPKNASYYLWRELPTDLINNYAGDLSMCMDSLIASYSGRHQKDRPFWEKKFEQEIARDLAHYGPNSHYEFAVRMYYCLKKNNILKNAIDRANERKKTCLL